MAKKSLLLKKALFDRTFIGSKDNVLKSEAGNRRQVIGVRFSVICIKY